MTLKAQLTQYFDENPDQAKEAFHEELLPWNPDDPTEYSEWVKDKDIDTELVKHFGGEDMGSNYYGIYKFTRGDETVFIKFHGWYASYDGSYYEGFNVVTPKEKTVAVYD